jgi:small-conductance mechanosensitive channel
MDLVSWQAALSITASVLLTAFLLNRFAPKERAHIRRLAFLSVLYLLAYGTTSALSYLGKESAAETAHIVTELFAAFSLINIGTVVLFDLILIRIGVDPATIVTDIVIGVGYIVALFSTLSRSGVELSKLAATSAVVTGILAIGMQATLGNIIGGVALQLDNSIHEGDWLQLENGKQGKVREIRWRHTVIETRDYDTIIVPNATLLAASITILGKRDGKSAPHRMWVHFNVDFRYSPADVIDAVETALRAAPIEGVAKEPPPNCICYDFARAENDSVARYAVRYFLTDLARDDPTSSRVRSRIFAALKRAGVPLAVPAAQLFVEEDDQERRERKKAREAEKRRAALSEVEILKPLTEDEIAKIAEGLRYAPFAAGETITKQGAIAHWLYIVTSGTAEVRVSGDGVEKTVAKIDAPGFFGEMGLMTGEPRLATVVALTPVECYRLDKEAFQKIMAERPEVAADISAVLAQRKVELQMARVDCDAAAKERRIAAAKSEMLDTVRKFFGLGGDSESLRTFRSIH